MKQRKGAVGARVMYCGHNGWFVADIVEIGDVCAISADPISAGTLVRGQNSEATHHVSDFPNAGLWKPEKGVLVVPSAQVRLLKPGEVP